MSEEFIISDSGPEVMERVLLQVLADLPEDRSTPLDGLVAEALLKKKVVTKEELFESINACKLSPEPVSLFQTLHSRGHISDSDVDILLELYEEQMQDEESSDFESDATFGHIALEKKHTTKPELWKAIQEQEHRRAAGEEKRLGEIMVNRGTLTISQAKDILITQGKRILRCPACDERYNVKNYSPEKEYSCLSCGGKLSDTGEVVDLGVSGTAFEKTIQAREPAQDGFIGREIGGCKILSKIGEGGMGAVYKARHLRLKRMVAVKIMAPGLLGDVHRKRFFREARAAAQLDHPNIMIVHDVDEFEGSLYIIMQYIDGKTVGEILDAKGKIDQVDAVRIILEAAQALDSAHQRNIVHRDIKPDNIMLTQSGQVKVMDFGLAKRTGSEQEMGVTATGVILGTPLYMSPEQFNAEVLDGRSDIYSLGVTFFHMVAGRPPFTGKTPYDLRDKHMKTPPPSPRIYSPELSSRVCSIIDRMLAKAKKDRYASTTELISDLKGVQDELSAKLPVPPEPAGKRSALTYAVPALLAAIAAAILALLLWGSRTPVVDEELEMRAAEVFTGLKSEVDRLLPQEKFYECLQVLASFPEEYSQTRAQKSVDAQRARILEAAIAVFEKLQTQVKKLLDEGKFEQASAVSDKVLERLNKIEKDIRDLPQAAKVVELVEKVSDTGRRSSVATEKLEQFDQARARAESSIAAGKLAEAEREINPFAQDNIPAIRTRANSILAEIAQKRRGLAQAAEQEEKRQESDRFEKAKKLAFSDMREKQFAEATKRIEPFAESKFGDIREEALQMLSGIAHEEQAYQAALADAALVEQAKKDIKLADEALRNGDYQTALEIAGKYAAATSVTGAQRLALDRLREQAKQHQEFDKDLNRVDKLVSDRKIAEAKGLLRKWRESEVAYIRNRAASKYAEMLCIAEPDMVYFEAGTFTVGSANTVDRNPRRKATVKAFYIDVYEVTNAQYARFVKAAGHKPPQHWPSGRVPEGQENYPVIWVTQADATAYAKWAGKRLPSEEEWEIAAGLPKPVEVRLGVVAHREIQPYPWGDTFERGACNINSKGAKPAGSFPKDKSPVGAFDMAGNVCEWTGSKDGKHCVVRGGDWNCKSSGTARTAYRFSAKPDMASAELGFRCAKDAK